MKNSTLAFIFLCIVAVSCKDNPVEPVPGPDSGFIRSKVNGVETVYSGRVENPIVHSMHPNELFISFQKGDNKYLTWSIVVIGVDFQNIEFPYTITGPNLAGRDEPTFWINIMDLDPNHSAYGKGLAGTTNLYWDTTLTITSIDGNTVRGTFSGAGVSDDGPGFFKDGEFLAVF